MEVLTVGISNKKAMEAAKVLLKFCEEQSGCQNCIFRRFGADRWNCQIEAYDLRDTLDNIKRKKSNRGYL